MEALVENQSKYKWIRAEERFWSYELYLVTLFLTCSNASGYAEDPGTVYTYSTYSMDLNTYAQWGEFKLEWIFTGYTEF